MSYSFFLNCDFPDCETCGFASFDVKPEVKSLIDTRSAARAAGWTDVFTKGRQLTLCPEHTAEMRENRNSELESTDRATRLSDVYKMAENNEQPND